MLYGNSDVEINCIILLLNSRITMLLGSLSHVFIVGSNVGQTVCRGKVELYWLPTPFACFPFTSPPTRLRVPLHSAQTLPSQYPHSALTSKNALRCNRRRRTLKIMILHFSIPTKLYHVVTNSCITFYTKVIIVQFA